MELASLYLGTDKKSQEVVHALQTRHRENARLRSRILLDYLRGSRRDRVGDSSLSTLTPLKNSTRLALYHTPALRGVWKRILPQRINEVIGLQHMKIYVIDNDVLLSGYYRHIERA